MGWYDIGNGDAVADAALSNIAYLAEIVIDVAELWIREVFGAHRKLARLQTGLHPPVYDERDKILADALAEIDRRFGPDTAGRSVGEPSV